MALSLPTNVKIEDVSLVTEPSAGPSVIAVSGGRVSGGLTVICLSASTAPASKFIAGRPLPMGGVTVPRTAADGNSTSRAVPAAFVRTPSAATPPLVVPPGKISKLVAAKGTSTTASGTGAPDESSTVTSRKTFCSVRSWTRSTLNWRVGPVMS